MKLQIIDTVDNKIIRSDNFNLLFNKKTGFTATSGRTTDEDALMCPIGPTICDIEISAGKCIGCQFCYKSNSQDLPIQNMSFETYKKIFNLLPRTVTQIAFGITTIENTPDLWKIMEYTRENGVIPNLTINGVNFTDYQAERLAYLAGAVAVSCYSKDVCYDAVDKLVGFSHLGGATLRQINIHQLLSANTYQNCFELIKDRKVDPRLQELNAIVFLLLKPKGERNFYRGLNSQDDYELLIEFARIHNVQIGMDSCSAPLMLKAAEALEMEEVIPSIQPCESTLESFYIDVNGRGFPCSFSAGTDDWKEGINLLEVTNFTDEVWLGERVTAWRNKLLNSSSNCNCKFNKTCRSCPLYPEINICKGK